MHWTQHPGLGPGAELLGNAAGRLIPELRCGPGHHLAHLVRHHQAIGIGVDAAPAQIRRARALNGHIVGLSLVTDAATAFMTTTEHTFDIVYCIFCALGLSPPDPILTGIRQPLRPGGRLAFSTTHHASTGDHPASPAPEGCIRPA